MTLTFEQAAEQLGKMADRMEPHVARGLSYGLEKHVREAAVVETVKRGVGRRLWYGKRAGAFAMFKRDPIRLSGGKVVTAVIVKGLPALAETGGQTLPHVIRPKTAALLAFQLGGRRVVLRKVMHPGSRIAKRPVMLEALDRGAEKVAAEIANSLDAFILMIQQERA